MTEGQKLVESDRERRKQFSEMLEKILAHEELVGKFTGIARELKDRNLESPVETVKTDRMLKHDEFMARTFWEDYIYLLISEVETILERIAFVLDYPSEVVLEDINFLDEAVVKPDQDTNQKLQNYYAVLIGHSDERVKNMAHERLQKFLQ